MSVISDDGLEIMKGCVHWSLVYIEKIPTSSHLNESSFAYFVSKCLLSKIFCIPLIFSGIQQLVRCQMLNLSSFSVLMVSKYSHSR